MTTKKFLIQIESAENTRWFSDDKDVAAQLQATAEIVARANTNGTEPRATVTLEEAPCQPRETCPACKAECSGCQNPRANLHTCTRHA